MKQIIIISLAITAILFDLCGATAGSDPVKLPRIGFIYSTGNPETPSVHSAWFEAFQVGLRDLGYSEGKNILIERRYAEGRLDRMPALVTELVEANIDVLFAVNNVVIRAAKQATRAIPIVMLSSVDPVAAGYIDSFARPGGNITGLAWLSRDLSAKRVELLKEVLPRISRFGVLWDANGPGPAIAVKEYEAAARGFKLDIQSLEVTGPNPDLAAAFQSAKAARAEGLIVVGNALMSRHAKVVFEFAANNRLLSIAEEGRYVDAGGLISYGANLADLYRRAAVYVADILKGARPGDLQVKLPERFEIFINLKTAHRLGVAIPQHVLMRADKVIK